MTYPIASHATSFSAVLHPLAGNVSIGYAITEDPTQYGGFVVATTAALAASYSGRIKGIAIQAGSGGHPIEIQQDAVVRPEHVPFVGTGNATDYAVVDLLGRVVRSASATGAVGKCGADGSVALQLSGVSAPGASLPISLVTDVTGILPRGNGGTGLSSSGSAGNVLKSDGTTWITGAINLAGGSGHVTGVLPASNQASQSIGGDGSGTTAALTVIRLQGRDVSNSAPSTGNGLHWSGTAWAPAALNLAGGANYITGTLPTANQAAQSIAGDGTGTTAALVVAKVNGSTVPAGGALTTGQVLRVTGAAALGYGTVDLANANAVSGTLPVARGGTNLTAAGTNGQVLATVSGAPAWSLVNLASTATVTGALPIGNGGTGLASVGASGTVLTSNGSAAAWSAIPNRLLETAKSVSNGGAGAPNAAFFSSSSSSFTDTGLSVTLANSTQTGDIIEIQVVANAFVSGGSCDLIVHISENGGAAAPALETQTRLQSTSRFYIPFLARWTVGTAGTFLAKLVSIMTVAGTVTLQNFCVLTVRHIRP